MNARTQTNAVTEDPVRVGVYRGLFAPVHNGHVNAAKLFMEQMRLDYLFIIPMGIKEDRESSLHRLRMCELAFANMDGVVVSDTELRRGEGSALSTVRELSADGRRLLLLCGTDGVLDLDKQPDYRELLALCYPVYIRRENDRMLDNMIVGKLSKYYSETGKMFRKLTGDPVVVSSSEIRGRVREGKDISHLVPPLVESYIRTSGLYKKS